MKRDLPPERCLQRTRPLRSPSSGIRMRLWRKSEITLFALVVLFTAASCSLPAGSLKVSTVIARRRDASGKPLERIREDETISKHFYTFTPDGPFVTRSWPSRFEYSIVDNDGNQQLLKFLTRHEPYEQ